MTTQNLSSQVNDAVDNYYNYNPDTLMPLLLIALAAQGKLQASTQRNPDTVVFCQISYSEVISYDWVKLNPALRKRVKAALDAGQQALIIESQLDDTLQQIYQTFHHYDTFTVEEEYHHRIGILHQHSSHGSSDAAQRQYATICLAEALLNAPDEWLSHNFLSISNHMLVRSGLQPERPRLQVAHALASLLQYDGQGRVYNPFAGCAIAAAAIPAGSNMYADGNKNDKLFAVARLLNYGTGGSCEHYQQSDSTQWNDQGPFDYVMCTYRGYVNGQSAFDFCLGKCFDTLSPTGRFAGIVAPKDIFERQSPEFREALKRDWVETIVLLPFAEVAVLINANKNKQYKSKVRFFNLTHPMLQHRPISTVLCNDDYADILRNSDVKKKGFIRDLILPNISQRDGYRIVKLGDFVQKLKKQTFSLTRIAKDNCVLATIDRKAKYQQFDRLWMNGIDKRTISKLFAPAYHLTTDCLITNSQGQLEPRLFNASNGTAFFQDGFAFKINVRRFNTTWLIWALNEDYVQRQLHPYGMDVLLPEAITEEQVLNLKLYCKIEDVEDDEDEEGEYIEMPDFEEEEISTSDSLPVGYQLTGNRTIYTIHKFLGHGNFGYAYSAEARNLTTGDVKEVVLKEFYPFMECHREGDDLKAVPNDCTRFDIETERQKFAEEAKIMHQLGTTPDSHIVPAEELFESDKTNTLYYVMPFYHAGSLDDLQKAGTTFTEDLLINTVIKPLCKALHIAHHAKVLHLDIKPENILVDEHGEAALTDFGVAKQYDDGGSIINSEGVHGTSCFAAPEMRVHGSAMIKFGTEPDIFGLAASVYNLATKCNPHPIQYNSDEDRDLLQNMHCCHLSEAFANAIVAGLQASAPARPRSAQAFLNLFPGCEDIKL